MLAVSCCFPAAFAGLVQPFGGLLLLRALVGLSAGNLGGLSAA